MPPAVRPPCVVRASLASFTSGLPRAAVTVAAAAIMGGCGGHDRVVAIQPVEVDLSASTLDTEIRPEGAFTVLELETPDGSGQTVHPDYASVPGPAPAHFLVATPYAYSKVELENPSIFARNADFTWSPLVAGPLATSSSGYLSDPDVVAVPDAGLWVYYREVAAGNRIHLIRSPDGVTFGAPQLVVEAAKHEIISPAVVRRGAGNWLMWSVNGGSGGCTAASTKVELRRSVDGVAWKKPVRVRLTQPGVFVWHIDVQWIPSRNEYWALYNVKTPGNCSTAALYLAVSADGVSWQTFPTPVLERGAIPEFADIVYRSTFAYDPRGDNIRFWYSGARHGSLGFVWRSAFQRRSRADVFDRITRPSMRALATLVARPGVPLLLDGP